MTFPASSVAFWRKMDAIILLYRSFNQAEQWCDVTFYSRFFEVSLEFSLYQANFSRFDIVHKIDDRKLIVLSLLPGV